MSHRAFCSSPETPSTFMAACSLVNCCAARCFSSGCREAQQSQHQKHFPCWFQMTVTTDDWNLGNKVLQTAEDYVSYHNKKIAICQHFVGITHKLLIRGNTTLTLGTNQEESRQTETSSQLTRSSVFTFECGTIPKALVSARWLKCSSVLRDEKMPVNLGYFNVCLQCSLQRNSWQHGGLDWFNLGENVSVKSAVLFTPIPRSSLILQQKVRTRLLIISQLNSSFMKGSP